MTIKTSVIENNMYFSSTEKGLKDVVRFIILNPYQEPLTEKLKK